MGSTPYASSTPAWSASTTFARTPPACAALHRPRRFCRRRRRAGARIGHHARHRRPIADRQLAVLLRNHLTSSLAGLPQHCMAAPPPPPRPFGGMAQSLIRRGIGRHRDAVSIPDGAAVACSATSTATWPPASGRRRAHLHPRLSARAATQSNGAPRRCTCARRTGACSISPRHRPHPPPRPLRSPERPVARPRRQSLAARGARATSWSASYAAARRRRVVCAAIGDGRWPRSPSARHRRQRRRPPIEGLHLAAATAAAAHRPAPGDATTQALQPATRRQRPGRRWRWRRRLLLTRRCHRPPRRDASRQVAEALAANAELHFANGDVDTAQQMMQALDAMAPFDPAVEAALLRRLEPWLAMAAPAAGIRPAAGARDSAPHEHRARRRRAVGYRPAPHRRRPELARCWPATIARPHSAWAAVIADPQRIVQGKAITVPDILVLLREASSGFVLKGTTRSPPCRNTSGHLQVGRGTPSNTTSDAASRTIPHCRPHLWRPTVVATHPARQRARIVNDPDRIYPGQVLVLTPPPAAR